MGTMNGPSVVDHQSLAAGFRQERHHQDDHRKADNRYYSDGFAQCDGAAEVTDQRRREGAHSAPEVVDEPLARTAHPARVQLGQERAASAEIARNEEAERESAE